MNGPEHYAEAERLLAKYADLIENGPSLSMERLHGASAAGALLSILAEAQVHATLASVAVQAASYISPIPPTSTGWRRIARGDAAVPR